MAVNKVVLNGETLIDLTGDTVTPDKLLKGVVAHNAKGEIIVGTLEPDVVLYPQFNHPVQPTLNNTAVYNLEGTIYRSQ